MRTALKSSEKVTIPLCRRRHSSTIPLAGAKLLKQLKSGRFAVIQPAKLGAVKEALIEAGIEGMTILKARGHGRQKGHTEFYRGREYTIDLLPKVKIKLVVNDNLKDKAVQAIHGAARTGQIGDGRSSSVWSKKPSASATTNAAKPRFRL